MLVITPARAAFLLGQALIGSPGPAGLAFYVPPSPLAAGPVGEVIWSRPVTGAAALPGAAANLLVLYHSSTLAGRDTAVSGTIAIPPGQPPAEGWPVLSWTHGTTGVADICAPSPLRSTDHIARSLHASGAMLAYHRFPGRGHYDLIQAAHPENVRWLGARKTQGRT